MCEVLPETYTFRDEIIGIKARADTVEIAFEAVVESFHAIESQRFLADGPGWEALSPNTEIRKSNGNWGSKMMVRTGDLFASLANGAEGYETIMTNISVTMETTIPYAGYHQTGTEHMPARELVKVDEKTAALWGGIIGEYIFGGAIHSGSYSEVQAVL